MDFFLTSSRNVLAAETAAGVSHHVALSVVGTDRLPDSGYFRAKLAQEEAIKAATMPYTIVRATQFFEFLGRIAESNTDGETVLVPPVLVQPEAADDVAAALAVAAVGAPVNGTVELAGPERFRLDELVRRVLRATGDARGVTADDRAPLLWRTDRRPLPHPRRRRTDRSDPFRGLARQTPMDRKNEAHEVETRGRLRMKPTIVEPVPKRTEEDEMSTNVPPSNDHRPRARADRARECDHGDAGGLHPRPLAAAEQLGQLGGLLQAGRLRAADAGLAGRSGNG